MSSTQGQKVAADESRLTQSLKSDQSDQNFPPETDQFFQEWLSTQPEQKTQQPTAPYVPNQPREIVFEGTLRVDGYMAGMVRSDLGTLIVSAAGVIDGDVSVNDATINGTVRGDIRATTHVRLGSSARVIGDIATGQLLIEPGAVFEGRCVFSSNPEAREAA